MPQPQRLWAGSLPGSVGYFPLPSVNRVSSVVAIVGASTIVGRTGLLGQTLVRTQGYLPDAVAPALLKFYAG
eukprot:473916-Amphidinium_carterae.1